MYRSSALCVVQIVIMSGENENCFENEAKVSVEF
jgi:hypothetical protein